MKKTREQKITGQIDRLLKKNLADNQRCENLIRRNAALTHSILDAERMELHANGSVIESLEQRIQRRAALLKRKGFKLSEEKTVKLL